MDDAALTGDQPKPKKSLVDLTLPVRVILTLILVASALLYQGYNLSLAIDPDDSNHLETPLILTIQRELTQGPESLYGPYSGKNPAVLIHAPLYYRLAAVAAWPAVRAGCTPMTAAMGSGRAISALGMLMTLLAGAWIAGMDEGSWFEKIWAASLIASAGVFGSFSASVRPDTLAIGLQTQGFAIVVWSIRKGGRFALVVAFLLFALAFCTKQNLVVAATVAVIFALLAAFHKQIKFVTLLSGLIVAVIVAFGYYYGENSVTHGEMFRAVFTTPAKLGSTVEGRGSWPYAGTVFWESAKRSLGLLALGIVLLATCPKRVIGTKLDLTLWIVLLAETAAMVPLCVRSSGAWVNYAMPSAVWGSILLARWLYRGTADSRIGLKPVVLMLAALAVLFGVYRLVRTSSDPRGSDRELLMMLLDDPVVQKVPRDALYFVGLPQFNRMYGNMSLAHDEWLYKNFEALGEAEPREVWLEQSLKSAVHLVVVPSSSPLGAVPGVSSSLSDLGYHQIRQIGPYALWSRDQDEP